MALNRTNIVEKQNVLNEIRSNNMTIQELRFFSIYLSMIKARDPKSRVARFPIARFQKIMELGKIRISHMKTTTNNLLCKVISVNRESGGYNQFQLFKECIVDKDEKGDWYVEIDCHDKALPYLFEYKTRYFRYELWNALRLKSANQLRMYEILKQYEKIGEREIEIGELKALIGISQKEYPKFERFKTCVINVCQRALAEYTDIKFTYEPIKRGKGGKIVAIKFNIHKNIEYVDQIGLDEYYDLQSEPELIIDVEYTDKSKNTEYEGQRKIIFKNENLKFLAEACNGEFTEEQMDIIKSYLVKLVPFDSKTYQIDQYDYLLSKYKELNYRANRQDLAPLKNRFAYLKSLFEIEIKNIGETYETKW